jgi:hypothetical protein
LFAALQIDASFVDLAHAIKFESKVMAVKDEDDGADDAPKTIEVAPREDSVARCFSDLHENHALLISKFEAKDTKLKQKCEEHRNDLAKSEQKRTQLLCGLLRQLQQTLSSAEARAVKLESENRELRKLTAVEVTDVDEGTTAITHVSSTAALALKRSRGEFEAGSSSAVQAIATAHKNVKVKVEAAAAGKEEAEVELDRIQTCAICFDAPRQVFFSPCSHYIACRECSDRLWESSRECPMCRKKIEQQIKVMMA